MGVVHRAVHETLDRIVAVKLVAPAFSADPQFRDRFLREARAVASLDHPAVVPVYDAGESDGVLYLAMRFVEGGDLAGLLARGPLAPAAALAIAEQVAGALDSAHAAGIVHRDVKPANVMLEGARAYLTDFGLAKRDSGATALTEAGQVVGTLDYLSPEQIEGGVVGVRSDVYALACVLFHCLAGVPPYQRESEVQVMFAHVKGEPPSLVERRPDLPRALDAVVARGMAKDPGVRFASAGELVAAAAAVLGPAVPGATRTDGAAAPLPRVLVVASQRTRALVRAALAGQADVAEADAAALPAAVGECGAEVVVVEAEAGASAALCRAVRGAGDVPVIALVARRDTAERRALQELADVLPTPFSALQLAARTRRAVEARRA